MQECFWTAFWGRSLIWEFYPVLEALARWRAPPTCPLGRPLIELHRGRQVGPGGCIIQVAAHRPATQVLSQPGSGGLLNSENPHFVFSVFLPVPLDRGPPQLPGPLGVSQGHLKVLGRWL